LFEKAGIVARMSLKPGAIPVCKECSREMVPEEWVLRKGQCVVCKTKHELEAMNKPAKGIIGVPSSLVSKVASNQCKCGALLGEHKGEALTCVRTKCGGYNH
jgi:hypothetical protein